MKSNPYIQNRPEHDVLSQCVNKFSKNSNFLYNFFIKCLTHNTPWNEIDLANIVEDTERTRFRLQMDGRTDWRTDKAK